jgi:hypothetical protein
MNPVKAESSSVITHQRRFMKPHVADSHGPPMGMCPLFALDTDSREVRTYDFNVGFHGIEEGNGVGDAGESGDGPTPREVEPSDES